MAEYFTTVFSPTWADIFADDERRNGPRRRWKALYRAQRLARRGINETLPPKPEIGSFQGIRFV